MKMTKHTMSKKWIAATLMIGCGGIAGAENHYTMDRYQGIIDRKPFGAEPIIETAILPPVSQTQIANDLRLSMLFEASGGKDARAGVVISASGKQEQFICTVGEAYKGIKLVEIDFENSNATIERNGVTALLELKKGKQSAVAMPPRGDLTRRITRRVIPAPTQSQNTEPEPIVQPTEEERAEIQENLRNYQMEVIRRGMPPLPIPLTPEMDAQLVEEGVLPPSE